MLLGWRIGLYFVIMNVLFMVLWSVVILLVFSDCDVFIGGGVGGFVILWVMILRDGGCFFVYWFDGGCYWCFDFYFCILDLWLWFVYVIWCLCVVGFFGWGDGGLMVCGCDWMGVFICCNCFCFVGGLGWFVGLVWVGCGG